MSAAEIVSEAEGEAFASGLLASARSRRQSQLSEYSEPGGEERGRSRASSGRRPGRRSRAVSLAGIAADAGL